MVLFVGSQRLGAGLDLETAIHHRLTAQTLELGLVRTASQAANSLAGARARNSASVLHPVVSMTCFQNG